MAVKQSASKEEFLKALGLNQQNPGDKRKLGEMWVSCHYASMSLTINFMLSDFYRKR